MKISYKRETKRNYLVIEDEGEIGYEAQMLSQNHIRGLLRMYVTYEDGIASYCYDITSRQPLSRLLEVRFITKEEIVQLMIQLHNALTGLEEYLLNGGGILLEPEYIYVEPELFQAGFCLIPGKEGIFQQKLSCFLQLLLKRIDHRDRECVVLAYGLYQESLKENSGIEDLMALISFEKNNKKTKYGETELEEGGGEESNKIRTEENDHSRIKDEKDEPEERQLKNGSKNQKKNRGLIPLWNIFLIWLAVIFMIPTCTWFFLGKNMLVNHGKLLIILAAGLLFVLMALRLIILLLYKKMGGSERERTEKASRIEEEDTWRILYNEEEDESGKNVFGENVFRENEFSKNEFNKNEFSGNGLNRNGIIKNETDKNEHIGWKQDTEKMLGDKSGQIRAECFQTVLLSERSCNRQEIHRLTALDGSGEDIELSYFPFVIGKHKDLADYVLQNEAVSRLHVRLDQDQSRFTITDLNSTNGTKVRGKLLEANETVEIGSGDSVYIADKGYIFS